MAPVVHLARLVWSGPLFTSESWSCSLHFHNEGSAVPLPASAYAAPLTAWMARAGSHLSSAAKLEEVKFNIIDPVTGLYQEPVSNNHLIPSPVPGLDSPTPGQLSLCITTGTALARGRGHAGRFYPPTGAPTAIGPTDGTTTSAVAESMGDSAAQLIDALNAVDPMFRAVVFSKAGQLVQPITHLRVGRVYDTMRSRRAQLNELYVSSSPVAP